MTLMDYKSYTGTVDLEDHPTDGLICVGRVLNMGGRDGITYQSPTLEGIEAAFKEAVDDYLAWAEEDGFDPAPPLTKNKMIRFSDHSVVELVHKAAAEAKESVNEFVVRAARRRAEELVSKD